MIILICLLTIFFILLFVIKTTTKEKFQINQSKLEYSISYDNHTVSILHFLPNNLNSIKPTKIDFVESLYLGYPIIIHVNGISLDSQKTSFYRVGLYKMLQNLNYHVIVFNYSEQFPTKITKNITLLDIKTVYNYYSNLNIDIVLWGHSLGSSVIFNLLNTSINHYPLSIILENPFNNLDQLIYPKQVFLDFVMNQNIVTNNIYNIRIPILIMCSTYDYVVPFESSLSLFDLIKFNNKNNKIVIFKEFLLNGHTDLYKLNKMQIIVNDFIREVLLD